MADKAATILLVSEDDSNIFLYKQLLKPLTANVVGAKNLSDTLSQLGRHGVALVLLDLLHDDDKPFAIVEKIRSRTFTKNVPVIFITDPDVKESIELKGYQVGAVDFIHRPCKEEVLLSKCQVFIDLYHYRLKSQQSVLELSTYASKLEQLNRRLKQEVEKHEQTLEDKERLERIFLEGQKLQAVGTLAGGIAHDFNNILYAVLGYCDLAIPAATDEKLQSYIEKIKLAAEKGAALVESILSFSRQSEVEMSSLCLKKVIDETMALLQPTIPALVDLQVQFEHEHPGNVWGDPAALEQMFMNIINNSVDALGGKDFGKISVDIRNADEHKDFYVEHPHLKDGIRYIQITIEDNGCGMDPQTVSRAFEPFYTTKEVGEGTGLGLASAYGTVREHLGDIEIRSSPGEGTSMIIYLPKYEGNNDF